MQKLRIVIRANSVLSLRRVWVQVSAATSARTPVALDAALSLTRACSDLPIFLNALKGLGAGERVCV